jgi:hypothetical protein
MAMYVTYQYRPLCRYKTLQNKPYLGFLNQKSYLATQIELANFRLHGTSSRIAKVDLKTLEVRPDQTRHGRKNFTTL